MQRSSRKSNHMKTSHKETQPDVVWTCLLFIRCGQNHLARHSEGGGRGGRKTRLTEEEVGRQHQGMDRPGVHGSPRGQWRTEKNGGNWLWNHLWYPSDRSSRLRGRWRWRVKLCHPLNNVCWVKSKCKMSSGGNLFSVAIIMESKPLERINCQLPQRFKGQLSRDRNLRGSTCHIPPQPLQDHPPGHLGERTMQWSAQEMLDEQHKRVDICAHARTAHYGLQQKRLEEDLCWIIPKVPLMTRLIKGLNWTERKEADNLPSSCSSNHSTQSQGAK